MTDEEAVRRANALFYSAFESLHIERMEEIWLKQPYITCVHPGWPPLAAWGPIMASWERMFERTFTVKITLADIRVRVAGHMAWVVLTEHVESRHDKGMSTDTICTTNVFERQGMRWYIVHHHSSSVPPRNDDPSDRLQ